MESLSPSNFNYGFTFIELVIACALLSLLGSLLVPLSISSFYGYAVISDRDTLINGLQAARSKAMANIQGKSYSVLLGSDSFIVFPGGEFSSQNSANEVTPLLTAVEKSPIQSVVTFAALSGKTNESTIVLAAKGHTSVLTINAAGAIRVHGAE